MEISDVEYPKPWLKETRTMKKKKYDFSLVVTCFALLLLSIFIALTPIFVQVLIESSNNMLENAEKTSSDFFSSLLNNERNTKLTKFIDVISFVWLFLVVITWLLMTANENVIDYVNKEIEGGVFNVSINCFAATIIVCFVNIINKCTKIQYVYESVRKK